MQKTKKLENETISLEDAAKAAPLARMLHSTLDGIINHYKELAEHAAGGEGVPAAAAAAIGKVQGKEVKEGKAKKAEAEKV